MLGFYSTDSSRISSSEYGGYSNETGETQSAAGYWPGGWCDAGDGARVTCSQAGYLTWRDFSGRHDNPLGVNASQSYCHYAWNMNASTQATAGAISPSPNRCKASPGGFYGSGTFSRIQASGSTLRAKFWQMGVEAEPPWWNLEVRSSGRPPLASWHTSHSTPWCRPLSIA